MSVEVKDLPEITSSNLSYYMIVDDGTTTSKISIGNNRKTTRPYDVYSALLTQSGVGAPTVTILENTLSGAITWSYSDPGVFNGNLTGAFSNAAKVALPSGATVVGTTTSVWAVNIVDNDNIELRTIRSGTLTNSILNSTFVEIRIYY